MKKTVLFLFLLLSMFSFAQQKRVVQSTYSQSEIDLKLQLQEQKMESLIHADKINNLSRRQIESESDFENIKNDPEFIALLDMFYPLEITE